MDWSQEMNCIYHHLLMSYIRTLSIMEHRDMGTKSKVNVRCEDFSLTFYPPEEKEKF